MSYKIERPRNKVFWTALFPLFAFLLVLSQPQQASAQWTAPDAQGNISNTNAGRVGIGTAAPTRGKLEVMSDSGVAAGEHGLFYASRAGQGSGGVFMGYRANGTSVTGGYVRGISNMPLFIGTAATPEAMTITDAGNFGFGTTSPGSKFVFSANAANAPAPQDGTIFHLVNADSAKTRVTIDTFGNTAGPSVTFRSARGTAAAPSATLTGDALGIMYGTGYGTTQFLTAPKPALWMVATENWTDTAAGSAIYFNTVQNGTTATIERMRINNDGNVGIGIATPTEKLHVVGNGKVTGNLTVDGNIAAKYQDVAEWVPSTQKLSAGTVVILDTGHNNHVIASSTPYDTRVAGVVSAQPGIALGEAGEGKALVATTGRVKVRVDATRAPVRVGDLLVTGDTPGVAMLSQPLELGGVAIHRPGTIIGKALEPLEKGTGEILVLLSLQ